MNPLDKVECYLEAIQLLLKDFLESVKFVFIKGRNTDQDYYDSLVGKLNQVPQLYYKIYDQLSQNEIWSISKYSKVFYMVPKRDGIRNLALVCISASITLIMSCYKL